MTWPRLPIRVAPGGMVTHPDPCADTYVDPYTLPWVEGAESTLPRSIVRRYPEGPADLKEKRAVLLAKRPVKDDA